MALPRGYTVERILGRGATTVVELAHDDHGRAVVVKRVLVTGAGPELETARRRIRREAGVLAGIRHPSVVPLLDVEEDGADLVLVMPFVAGGSLADRVRARGPLPPAEVARMAGPLLDGLAEVHRHGVVHRDISPSNVLFHADGRAVLADFGVASSRANTVGLTGEGWTIGTPGFMAPEQARGERATAAADVFGLAATLVFALTGCGPYGAGSPELLAWRAAQGDLVPLPPGLPFGMARALAAMLDPVAVRRPNAAAARGGPTGTVSAPPAPPAEHGPQDLSLLPPDGASTARTTPVRVASTTVAPPGSIVGYGVGGCRPASRRRRGTGLVVGAGAIAAASGMALVAVLFAGRAGASRGRSPAAPAARTTSSPTTVPPCTPLPYQPCGQPMPAPFTDGRVCTGQHDDYDGNRANGCEAAPDTVNGRTLVDRAPLLANIVPAGEVDTYPTYVRDGFQFFCDGELSIQITAPAGTADRVDILRRGGTTVLASAVSTDGRPVTAHLADPSCAHDDSGWYVVRVTGVAGHSAAAYRLVRAGHF